AVAVDVQSGTRFADALAALPLHLGAAAAPLADSLIAADRYGLPLAPVLDRLAAEARQHRRRQADARARQLPVRLSLPLVLCTLPSFILLAVAPLLLAALSSLNT
ncbi:MAG: type II secretion system F family protein, partial [Actinobacteria bacterium]|nr:type II secretion system F family protein [Actinomycetota bacterium]